MTMSKMWVKYRFEQGGITVEWQLPACQKYRYVIITLNRYEHVGVPLYSGVQVEQVWRSLGIWGLGGQGFGGGGGGSLYGGGKPGLRSSMRTPCEQNN